MTRTRRKTLEGMVAPEIGEQRRRHFDPRGARPDLECLEVMNDFDLRSIQARWLLDWSPDSDAYAEGSLEIQKLATWWRVRFRDQRDGKWRTVHVPLKGTPPPPGWKEGK